MKYFAQRTKRNKKLSNNHGVTMAEVLMVVLIIGILGAVTFIGVLNYQKSLRQKKLDDLAETIYVSAQNQLTHLRLSGNQNKFQATTEGGSATNVDELSYVPSDWDEDASILPNLWYVTSDSLNSAGSGASYIMSSRGVEAELREKNWIIEYDPEAGSVYAVFYSEEETFNTSSETSTLDKLRDKSKRIDGGSVIGYYGGSISEASESTSGKASISVSNAETLEATFQYSLTKTTTGTVTFTISISDQHGHTREIIASTKSTNSEYLVRNLGRRYYLTLKLDDLSSQSKRFYYKYGAGNTSLDADEILCAGDILSISMEVESVGDYDFEGTSCTYGYDVNSLFADDSTMSSSTNPSYVQEAHVAYVRHLQNLDTSYYDSSASGNYTPVKTVAQTNDISFLDNTLNDEDWYDIYHNGSYLGASGSNISFCPITNGTVTSYSGSYDADNDGTAENHSISGLVVKTSDSNGGLFKSSGSAGLTLSDVWMLGPQISVGDASAGALIGSVSNNATIEGCRVYLSDANGDLTNKTHENIWISGQETGGLIGTVSGGTVSITNSFASLVNG
ncbi:MAG: type II secretion system GspH family protein, partial [Lachnospiraceae bacterium]|nr:type II secretion system GspH family protein [Lachnospiraceae bacterium]